MAFFSFLCSLVFKISYFSYSKFLFQFENGLELWRMENSWELYELTYAKTTKYRDDSTEASE